MGAKLTFGWVLLVIAALAWASLQGDPESISSYVPVTGVLLIPAPIVVLGIIEVGPRTFGREVWLIVTRRHKVFHPDAADHAGPAPRWLTWSIIAGLLTLAVWGVWL